MHRERKRERYADRRVEALVVRREGRTTEQREALPGTQPPAPPWAEWGDVGVQGVKKPGRGRSWAPLSPLWLEFISKQGAD